MAKNNPEDEKPFSLDEWEAEVRAEEPRNEAEAAERDQELATIAELRQQEAADAEEIRRMESWTDVDHFEASRRDRLSIGHLFAETEPGKPSERWLDEIMLGDVRELNRVTLETMGFTEEAIADSDAVLAEFEQLFSDCRRDGGSMDLAQIAARCWLRWRVPADHIRQLTPEQIVTLDRESRGAWSKPVTQDWATRLKALRERKHWSQDDAARELKTSKTTIQNIESGVTRKPHASIRKLIERYERES